MRNRSVGNAPGSGGVFQGLGPQGWSSLGLASTWLLLILYTVVSISSRGLFGYWGADYRAFRAAGEVAARKGLAAVYDLTELEPPQRELFEAYASPKAEAAFTVIPVPYLPVFIAPMGLLPETGPVAGWLLWTAVNSALMIVGFRRLSQHLGSEAGLRCVVFFLGSLPAFLTLAFGQVNSLLLIGVMGFVARGNRRDDFWAGVWLAALLIKPQLLILVVPALILARRWSSLWGLMVSSAATMAISWWLVGTEGLLDMGRLWLGYTGAMPTTYPESMMNVRALMIAVSPYMEGFGIALSALAMTIAVAILGLVGWSRTVARRLPDALASLYSASSLIAWHAHVHLALPLGALLLARREPNPPRHLFELTLVILPSSLFAILGLLIDAGAAHRVAGMAFFLVNLAVLVVVARQTNGEPRRTAS